MGRIQFKATRRLHDSGYRLLVKNGDLQYDQDPNSMDGIWMYPKEGKGNRILIHCKKDGSFEFLFDENDFELNTEVKK